MLYEEQDDWLNEYYGISPNNPQTAQMGNFNKWFVIISNNVKTALGLAVINPFSVAEIFLNLCWMFLGLSLFGYGIGNISSYINNANKLTLEKQETTAFFNELIEDNNIHSTIHKQVMDDINYYYTHISDTMFYQYSKVLSKPIFMKLETTMMAGFVDSFPVLDQMGLASVRTLKNISRFKSEIDIEKGSIIEKAYFITAGVIKVYNEEMYLTNEYKKGEIFGLSYFKQYILAKYDISLDKFFYGLSKNTGTSISSDSIYNSMKGNKKFQSLKDKSKLHGSIVSDIGDQVDDELLVIKYNNKIVASADIQYFEITYKNLESYLLSDTKSFYLIWKHNIKSYETITMKERSESKTTIRSFNSNDLPGMIVLEDGKIYDLNTSLIDNQRSLRNLIGYSINEITYYDSILYGFGKIKNISDISVGGVYMIKPNDDSEFIYSKIITKQFKLLTRTDSQFDNYVRIDQKYFNLRKSMLKAYVIFFEFKSENNHSLYIDNKVIDNNETQKKFKLRAYTLNNAENSMEIEDVN